LSFDDAGNDHPILRGLSPAMQFYFKSAEPAGFVNFDVSNT